MSDGYIRQRVWYGDNGGSLLVTQLVGQTTLVTHRAKHTIYVQRISVSVSVAMDGGTWSIEDSNGNSLTGPISTTTAPYSYVVDLGPSGVPLTVDADLYFVPSGAGAAGAISWEGYQRLVDGSTP